MRALEVVPGHANSARVVEREEPLPGEGSVLVETLAIGICGTDREIIAGEYGWTPAGESSLIIGHESLGRVIEAPVGCKVAGGDLVVGIVRRPDPVPCVNCAVGEWDMCRNGRYTECGIKERHGFCRERFRIEPDFVVKLAPHLAPTGMLLEPASILAKAWEHIDYIGRRARWLPKRVLVTGAGPVGLLAALMARQRGLEVTVFDRVEGGLKPELVKQLGGSYETGEVERVSSDADVVVECTGYGPLVFQCMQRTPPGAIICLTGISTAGRKLEVDAGLLNRNIVLENDVIFGSVNANRRHYEAAAKSLAEADSQWLSRLVSRRLPLESWQEALQPELDAVKTVIDFSLP